MKKLLWDVNKFTNFSTVYDTDGNQMVLMGKDVAAQLLSFANYLSLLDDDVEIIVNKKEYAELTEPLAQCMKMKYGLTHTYKIIGEDAE